MLEVIFLLCFTTALTSQDFWPEDFDFDKNCLIDGEGGDLERCTSSSSLGRGWSLFDGFLSSASVGTQWPECKRKLSSKLEVMCGPGNIKKECSN